MDFATKFEAMQAKSALKRFRQTIVDHVLPVQADYIERAIAKLLT